MTRCKIWCKYLGCKPTWNVHMGIVGRCAVRRRTPGKECGASGDLDLLQTPSWAFNSEVRIVIGF